MNKKHRFRPNERFLLYSYFLALVLLGTTLLSMPFSWSGAGGKSQIPVIDAFFTAVSAACVTGLITVDTSLWSLAGQWIILALIQAGGLGIVTFGMLYLVLPRIRIPLKSGQLLGESFAVERRISVRGTIKTILGTTLVFEFIGTLLLIVGFSQAGIDNPVFVGFFHAVSAFCNAGFSVFEGGMLPFRSNLLINLTLMVLIIAGGIGFVVIRDVRKVFSGRRRQLSFHSRLMLLAVPIFIVVGFIGYMLLDDTAAFSGFDPPERILATFFQSVTTRTAGFNTVDQSRLSLASRWLTLVLMIIGGGSGSTAGGIKVSTAFILFIVLLRGVNQRGDIRLLKRRISSADVSMAAMFFLKACVFLLVSILLLGILEHPRLSGFTTSQIVFECVSAFGTVGLSLGITGDLSFAGKLVIAATMFAGRIGLISLVIRPARNRAEAMINVPRGEVLIG